MPKHIPSFKKDNRPFFNFDTLLATTINPDTYQFDPDALYGKRSTLLQNLRQNATLNEALDHLLGIIIKILPKHSPDEVPLVSKETNADHSNFNTILNRAVVNGSFSKPKLLMRRKALLEALQKEEASEKALEYLLDLLIKFLPSHTWGELGININL